MTMRVLLVALLCGSTHGLLSPSSGLKSRASVDARDSGVVMHGEGTGGWGIGNSRDILPEEFARGGDRRAFEGYQLSDQGDFMQQVRKDAAAMKTDELDELMSVAKMAGINMKDPSTRLNKFGKDIMEEDDDDDLDLSVPL